MNDRLLRYTARSAPGWSRPRRGLDEWGYPIVDGGEVPRHLDIHARRAVAACPLQALRRLRGGGS